MRVMLLGAGGVLGGELIARVPIQHQIVAFTHSDLDVCDSGAVQEQIERCWPDWVINASGLTDVDLAERDPQLALAVNATAVSRLARVCKQYGSGLVHFSSDYVFDGKKDGFYDEHDSPNPINAYGVSKLEGERLIRATGVHHLIIRTQWLYGRRSKSFVSTLWDRAHSRIPTRAANDQFGCSTYVTDLAALVWNAVGQITGTFHVANRGRVSRYMLARYVFAAVGAPELVSGCSVQEFQTQAQRPRNTALSVTKVESALRYRVPDWRDALNRHLQAMSKSSIALGPQ